MLPDPALSHLSQVGRIARTTRRALARALGRGGTALGDGDAAEDDLEVTLRHLGHVREGFVITLRTSGLTGPDELRDLVRAILVDWSWLNRLGIRWADAGAEIEQPVVQVISFAHAAVTLGVLPRLPDHAVTFPSFRRTYADIPVPRSPGEVLSRIEEMETVIARGRGKPLRRLGRESVRRTYGYFEAGAWLAGEG